MAKTDLTLEIEFYKTVLHNCKVVFDVGCRDDNVFYDINPELEVHLFDPNEVNVAQETWGKPNLYFNNFALGNFEGVTEFHYKYGSILHRTEEPKFDGIHQKRIIAVNTIQNYCRERSIKQIDFLKIDTEGYDFEVIKGCGVDILKNIKYIQFEDWEEGYFGGISVNHVLDYFTGYNIYKLNTKPVNYIVTKEELPFDYKDIIRTI